MGLEAKSIFFNQFIENFHHYENQCLESHGKDEKLIKICPDEMGIIFR